METELLSKMFARIGARVQVTGNISPLRRAGGIDISNKSFCVVTMSDTGSSVQYR